jgi:cation transport ATPase
MPALDKWSIGHFLLGLYLGLSMRSLFWVLLFLIFWEFYEVFFRPDVKEDRLNMLCDVAVGFIGAVVGRALAMSFPIIFNMYMCYPLLSSPLPFFE